jgi:hypothetical protein
MRSLRKILNVAIAVLAALGVSISGLVTVDVFPNILSAHAAPDVVFRITPDMQSIEPGQTCTVNITFENLPPKEVGAVLCAFTLSWNSSILEATSMQEVAFHSATPEEEWFENIEIGNYWIHNHVGEGGTVGQASLAAAWRDVPRAIAGGYAPLTGNGTFATITFKGKQVGTSVLNFDQVWVIAYDPDNPASRYRYLPVASINGQIEQQTISSDINKDGTVDIYDTILLAHLFGTTPSDPKWNPTGDINSDGIIDVYDAMILSGTFGWQFLGS